MTCSTVLEKTRHALFNTTAPRYKLIMPAFGPLAASLVKQADLRPSEKVLDLGTGTGAVAFPVAQTAKHVVAIDYAPTMLRQAQQIANQSPAQNITFYQGDMHRLPHEANGFDVALASFGLNGVEPVRVFPEIWRVLRAAGRLIFQEWGEVDEASQLVKQALKAHQVQQAEGFLAELRQLGEASKAWDQLGGPEAIADLLQQVGFSEVNFQLAQEAIPLEPRTFYRYKTAWTPYQAELEAMSAEARAAVEADVVTKLETWTQEDGRFIWQPELLRVTAWK